MKDWIPLLQSLIWPAAVILLVFSFYGPVRTLLQAVTKRVREGDSFEASASVVKMSLGSSSPRTPSGPEPEPGAQPALDARSASPTPAETSVALDPADSIHLAHVARRDKSLDRDGFHYYRIQVFLVGDDDTDLDRVAKVVYHLHPTFYDPNRTVTNRRTAFELRTAGWGMFNLTADVHLKGESSPLRLNRYINF
jgi:hypothetical protein